MDSTTLAANAPTIKIKRYSCVLCSQRKVKCDRKDPCLNCVRAGAECIPSNPAPPRRRKRTVEVGLHERLQRCEDLLKTYGLSIDGENAGENQDRNQINAVPSENIPPAPAPETTHGTMISKPGMTRFVDSHLWSTLLDELRESKDILQQDPTWEDDESDTSDTSATDGSSLLFSSNFRPPKLTQLHPPPIQILRLWQIFIENVNPVLKIVHTPTLQVQILEASGNVATIPKGLEALLFAIYTLAIVSLSDDNCLKTMGESRETLMRRYSTAAEQALVRFGALQSSDLVALQALTLFLVGTRSDRNPQAFWILCGVAIRMAQRMGVHRDGALVTPKLPPFETEMRRRVWWHVMTIDFISGIHAGAGPSLLENSWDTRLPGNFNDGDLYPDMRELPLEHTGATEMIYVLMTYHMCQAFAEARYLFGSPDQRAVSLSEADKWFDELETRIRNKFLQYCDLSNPLHLCSEAAAISIIASKRLYAHHPRNCPAEKTSQERQAQMTTLFENSMSVLRYFCAFHSVRNVNQFQWHIKRHFQYDIFVFLLSDLRHRTLGPESNQGWQMVQDIYKCYPELLSSKTNELHLAVGELTLKAWGARELNLRTTNQFVETPDFILDLRSQRSRQSAKTGDKIPNLTNISYPAGPDQNVEHIRNNTTGTGSGLPWGFIDYDPSMPIDRVVSMDMAPMDWEYWDNLFREYDLQAGDATRGYLG
ncbi:uncharacterized protein BP5553_01196 [Venustampulla echinocandica]|uniref:Zn(2)-C6 fungal-type domain-containing protein n=1 Tax=Venustampulla echinocandica TaxID=2656787 RepID=A0A370U0C3_9HELO|nr:uncharacterized protein BP5553_01196 [Venustampulla echinocandica]RDL41217.1 hypothetical protein BP5553_01196 [Venustampulla echinocandica]